VEAVGIDTSGSWHGLEVKLSLAINYAASFDPLALFYLLFDLFGAMWIQGGIYGIRGQCLA
jgi:hypothetical protein